MLLHYLVKVETPKMHVNTTSAFNVNYKIAIIHTYNNNHFTALCPPDYPGEPVPEETLTHPPS